MHLSSNRITRYSSIASQPPQEVATNGQPPVPQNQQPIASPALSGKVSTGTKGSFTPISVGEPADMAAHHRGAAHAARTPGSRSASDLYTQGSGSAATLQQAQDGARDPTSSPRTPLPEQRIFPGIVHARVRRNTGSGVDGPGEGESNGASGSSEEENVRRSHDWRHAGPADDDD
jgi:hypothetical protein